MFRLIGYLIVLSLLGYGGYWGWHNQPQVRQFIEKQLHTTEFQTLEARYSAKQIIDSHLDELLTDGEHKVVRHQQLFYPYLLMEVKYLDKGGSTREGAILWGMDDGEMVIDVKDWSKSHGFQDCINAGAERNDFRLLQALSHGSNGTRELLAKELQIDSELLESWLERCRSKQLIVKQGGKYRLHFEQPRLDVDPVTRINQPLVTKSQKQAVRTSKNYTQAQIKRSAQAAFGGDFAIRSSREIFLPVYGIEVQNPDGSIATTYWNGVTGKRIIEPY